MDTIHSRFFWRGTSGKFKYHMVNWHSVCGSKDFGGLGIINTRVMNDCLLAQWIWRIHSAKNELWFKILKTKYFPRGVFREARSLKSSQFWKSVLKVKNFFQYGGEL